MFKCNSIKISIMVIFYSRVWIFLLISHSVLSKIFITSLTIKMHYFHPTFIKCTKRDFLVMSSINLQLDTEWQTDLWCVSPLLQGTCLSVWMEAEITAGFSSLWASMLRVPASGSCSPMACHCALQAVNSLILAFQGNELWIFNDILCLLVQRHFPGVQVLQFFGSFACQRLVTAYTWTVWEACGSLSLSTLRRKQVWAEQNLNSNSGKVFSWLGPWQKCGWKRMALWQWTRCQRHLISG